MKQPTFGARMLVALLPLICAVGFVRPASADIPAVLANAALSMQKLGSYHVEITTSTGTQSLKSVGDVRSLQPLRMRMTTDTGPAGVMQMIIIAPNAYMKQGNAPWKKYPGSPADYAQMDVGSMLAKDKNDYAVTDLGMQMKDGQMLHGYRALNKNKNVASTIYLDSSGRIARVEVGATVMRFSKYGEALNIAAPM